MTAPGSLSGSRCGRRPLERGSELPLSSGPVPNPSETRPLWKPVRQCPRGLAECHPGLPGTGPAADARAVTPGRTAALFARAPTWRQLRGLSAHERPLGRAHPEGLGSGRSRQRAECGRPWRASGCVKGAGCGDPPHRSAGVRRAAQAAPWGQRPGLRWPWWSHSSGGTLTPQHCVLGVRDGVSGKPRGRRTDPSPSSPCKPLQGQHRCVTGPVQARTLSTPQDNHGGQRAASGRAGLSATICSPAKWVLFRKETCVGLYQESFS